MVSPARLATNSREETGDDCLWILAQENQEKKEEGQEGLPPPPLPQPPAKKRRRVKSKSKEERLAQCPHCWREFTN